MAEMKPCPYCGDEPKTDYFTVNPMFGGGTAWRVECPNCHFAEGIEYRTRKAAVDGWNALVDEIENDLDWEKLENEARSELAREEGWEW